MEAEGTLKDVPLKCNVQHWLNGLPAGSSMKEMCTVGENIKNGKTSPLKSLRVRKCPSELGGFATLMV